MAAGDFQYTIRSGDTLSKIAAGLTIGGSAYAPAIANYNGIANPNQISAGASILIPVSWMKANYQTSPVSESGAVPSSAIMNAPQNSQVNVAAAKSGSLMDWFNSSMLPIMTGSNSMPAQPNNSAAQTILPGATSTPFAFNSGNVKTPWLTYALIGGAGLLLFTMMGNKSGTTRYKRRR